jgi:hypothetical protein
MPVIFAIYVAVLSVTSTKASAVDPANHNTRQSAVSGSLWRTAALQRCGRRPASMSTWKARFTRFQATRRSDGRDRTLLSER